MAATWAHGKNNSVTVICWTDLVLAQCEERAKQESLQHQAKQIKDLDLVLSILLDLEKD